MAAAAIAMLVRMKLSNEAAIEITSGTGQGITTVVGFAEMDKDGVDLMFRQLARPGGVDAAGVRNPGIKISALGHQTFGHMCYYANHMLNRVDRALTFPSITLATVKKLKLKSCWRRIIRTQSPFLPSISRIGRRLWMLWINISRDIVE